MMSKVLEKCFGCGVELSPYNELCGIKKQKNEKKY